MSAVIIPFRLREAAEQLREEQLLAAADAVAEAAVESLLSLGPTPDRAPKEAQGVLNAAIGLLVVREGGATA